MSSRLCAHGYGARADERDLHAACGDDLDLARKPVVVEVRAAERVHRLALRRRPVVHRVVVRDVHDREPGRPERLRRRRFGAEGEAAVDAVGSALRRAVDGEHALEVPEHEVTVQVALDAREGRGVGAAPVERDVAARDERERSVRRGAPGLRGGMLRRVVARRRRGRARMRAAVTSPAAKRPSTASRPPHLVTIRMRTYSRASPTRNVSFAGKTYGSDLCATGAAASLRGRDVPEPVPRPVSFSNGVCRTRAAKAAACCLAPWRRACSWPPLRSAPPRSPRRRPRPSRSMRRSSRSIRASPPPTSGSTSRTSGSRRSSTSRRSTVASSSSPSTTSRRAGR